MELTDRARKFVLHWGEMGPRWGVSRTVAQIHALLYLSPAPLNAEEISATLMIARSNVSTGLKELREWGIVRVVPVLGDRRDHFESMKDVWEMLRVVLAERKRREVDPTLAMLRECAATTGKAKSGADAFERERVEAMLDFFETVASLHDHLAKVPTPKIVRFARMGARIARLVLGAR